MKIDINDIITLEDNIEYVICNKTKYKNNIYYHICELGNPNNFKYCYFKGNDFLEITNKKEIELLTILFAKNILS